MNDRTFDRMTTNPDRAQARVRPRRAARAVVATDAAGMAWGHANPAELYRWLARRNALLRTIAAAVPQDSCSQPWRMA